MDPTPAPALAADTSVSALLRAGVARLQAAGSPTPRLDAELLLAAAIGVDRGGLIAHGEVAVAPAPALVYEASLARRERREPLAYIRGFREFHGLAFATDARALIPRPETELLVDAAITEVVGRLAAAPRAVGAPVMRVADVGTGSGAIAISLVAALRRRKMDTEVLVIAVDESPDALQLARENAVGHGVADRLVFMEADLLPHYVDPPYALVCANLPYVPTADLATLEPEIAWEPRAALDGGPDGLDVVRRLLDRLPDVLASDGVALLEIGADQRESIVAEVASHLPGWQCTIASDLAGHPRLARVERA